MTGNAKPKPSSPELLRLDADTRKHLLAVVVDTNTFGYGRPDWKNLAVIAERLADINVQTWVPELVAWEWAQHLADDWQKLQTAHSAERKNLIRGGVGVPDPLYTTPEAVIDKFMTIVSSIANVTIVKTTPHNALEGLKDQVLQRKPGRRKPADAKEGTKTGASDSTWMRDVLDKAHGAVGKLIFLTEDKDIARTFEYWSYPAPTTRLRKNLWATLFDVTVDDGHATREIIHYLKERLPNWEFSPEDLNIGNISNLEQALRDEGSIPNDATVISSGIYYLEYLSGIGKVSIESSPSNEIAKPKNENDVGKATRYTVSARVHFFGAVKVETWNPNSESTADSHIYQYHRYTSIASDLSFQFNAGKITSVSPNSDAKISFPSDTYSSIEEINASMEEALKAVPGIIIPDGFRKVVDGGEINLTVSGNPEIIKLGFDPEEYSFAMEMEGEDGISQVGIWYEPRPNESRFDNGEERLDLRNTSTAVAGGADFPDIDPVYAIPAWIINNLRWQAPAEDTSAAVHQNTDGGASSTPATDH